MLCVKGEQLNETVQSDHFPSTRTFLCLLVVNNNCNVEAGLQPDHADYAILISSLIHYNFDFNLASFSVITFKLQLQFFSLSFFLDWKLYFRKSFSLFLCSAKTLIWRFDCRVNLHDQEDLVWRFSNHLTDFCTVRVLKTVALFSETFQNCAENL